MTVGVELRLSWWRRLRLLFGGSLYATILLKPSWYVHLEATPGEAWERHELTSNQMLAREAFRVFAYESLTYGGCTIQAASGRE